MTYATRPTPLERRTIERMRSLISQTGAHVELYASQTPPQTFVRSVIGAGDFKGNRQLPPDALLVGLYGPRFPGDLVIEDLRTCLPETAAVDPAARSGRIYDARAHDVAHRLDAHFTRHPFDLVQLYYVRDENRFVLRGAAGRRFRGSGRAEHVGAYARGFDGYALNARIAAVLRGQT